MSENTGIKVGVITQEVISALNLSVIANTPVYIGQSNIDHMKKKHGDVYEKYNSCISDIIQSPDYVGVNNADNSIEYVKQFVIDDEYVKVAIRVSSSGKHYARSMYILNNNRVNNFIQKGTLKPLDK